MKRILLQKAFQPFFITGLIAASIALFLKIVYPASLFDISIYNSDIQIENSKIWMAFALYLFLLAGIYYIVNRNGLRVKRWLVISHYVFILLFLLFFVLFSAFGNDDVQGMIASIPLSTIITVYGIIFLADVSFFVIGLLLLFVSLFSLNKSQKK
jgi:hypothetical protein